MAKQTESLFRIRLEREMRAIPSSWWLRCHIVWLAGIPDILGCINGRFVALELKTEKGRASPLQGWVLAKILAAGGFVAIVRPGNKDRVLKELRSLGGS